MVSSIPEPWKSFLYEIDSILETEVQLVCLGGFVIAMMYNFDRSTADIDFIQCVPRETVQELQSIGGEFMPLHKKYGIYLDFVTVVTLPDNYADRLVEIFPGELEKLQLYALGPYDLALSKLERNLPHDREDMLFLVQNAPLEISHLKHIYENEVHVYLEDNPRHRSTFDFWLELIKELGL